jgi:hypothetical protein
MVLEKSDPNELYLEEDIVTIDTPIFISDVTTPVRFNMDENGLTL